VKGPVVLMGLPASGKTTLGRALAEALGWRFVDLDDFIEEQEKRSIPEIFSRDGVEAFRALEARWLPEVLRDAAVVVALGGGTVELPDIAALLQGCRILYLVCSREEALARLARKPRPLHDPHTGVTDFQAAQRTQYDALRTRREPLYRALGGPPLSTTGVTLEAALNTALTRLNALRDNCEAVKIR